jgi:hypothetical protein
MKIKKVNQTFNTYSVELSWGQLNAIYRALEPDHADPLADELFAELGWYLQNVPGPGEDEEEYKEAKDAEKEALAGGGEGMGMDGEGRNMDQIGQEVEGGEEGEGPAAGKDLEGAEPPQAGRGVGAEEGGEGEEADRLLEKPPQRSMAA